MSLCTMLVQIDQEVDGAPLGAVDAVQVGLTSGVMPAR
jgi:hypothetical protein